MPHAPIRSPRSVGLAPAALAAAGLLLFGACGEETHPYEPEGDGIYLALQVSGIIADGMGNRVPGAYVQLEAGFLRPDGVRYVPLGATHTGLNGEYRLIATETGSARAGFWWLLPPDDIPPDRYGDITVYLRLTLSRPGLGRVEVEREVYRKRRATAPVDGENYRLRWNSTL